jgi:hypothetical protein
VPFLRVIRDKRGYETTYLMHWYREGNRQRSRILYVFRTPGGVRVGREALEPEILRQIETEYPDIDFDWQVVVDNQQVVETSPEPRRPRKRRRDEEGDIAPVAAPVVAKPVRPEPAPPAPSPGRPPIPSIIDGATPDEQIGFLMHWYPLIRERIPQRTPDPARQETLFALAERRVLSKRRRRARKAPKPDQAGDSAPALPPDSSTPGT